MSILKLVSSSFIYRFIGFLLAFVGSIFVTRLLGAEGKGILAYLNAFVNLLTIILGFDVMRSLTYNVAVSDENASKARGLIMMILISSFLIFTFFIWGLFFLDIEFLSIIIPFKYQSNFYLLYITVLIFMNLGIAYFNGDWQGQARFIILNKFIVLTAFIHALIFLGVFITKEYFSIHLEVRQIFFIIILVNAIKFGLRLIFYLPTVKAVSLDLKDHSILRYSFIGWLTGLLSFLIRRFDFWIVDFFWGSSDLGIYSVAANLVDFVIALGLTSTFVLSPYITKMNKVEGEELLAKFSRVMVTIMIVGTLLCFPLIKFTIPLLYGIEFSDSVIPLQLLISGAVFIFMRNIFFVYNIATDNLKHNFISLLFTLISAVLLALFLIPKFGIQGASIATTITYFFSFVITTILFFRDKERSFSFYFIIQKSDMVQFLNFVRR